MSDKLFCNIGNTDYDAHRLLEKLAKSIEPCHVFGVAFETCERNVYRISSLIIQSESNFSNRWEAKPHEIDPKFARYLAEYHECIRKI